jgi:hypothetical protein
MADIYKHVRKMDEKAYTYDNELENKISKLVSAKPMFTNP